MWLAVERVPIPAVITRALSSSTKRLIGSSVSSHPQALLHELVAAVEGVMPSCGKATIWMVTLSSSCSRISSIAVNPVSSESVTRRCGCG